MLRGRRRSLLRRCRRLQLVGIQVDERSELDTAALHDLSYHVGLSHRVGPEQLLLLILLQRRRWRRLLKERRELV
jgi:hypothetical protein